MNVPSRREMNVPSRREMNVPSRREMIVRMSLRWEMNVPFTEIQNFGYFARAKGNGQHATLCRAQSPCSVSCRPISKCTPSLTWRLSASLSLGSASTRRSPATSGRCWACIRVAMVAIKGARCQGTGRGCKASCALRRPQTCARSGRGHSNSIRIFKHCCPQTPDARRHELLEDADEGVAQAR